MAETLKSFFDERVVRGIAAELSAVHRFDTRGFVAECLDGLSELEFVARGWHIAEVLRRHLPRNFGQAAEIIVRSLPATAPAGMGSFRYLPHTCFVSKYGLDDFDSAMAAQHALTQRFTAEYSIRAFLERHQAQTLECLLQWASDPSHHVRRLVSEGTRPRLPWATRLRAFQKDPAPVIALLELLKDDPELYVRRSVANNLNDIAKDHPGVVIEVCSRWWQGGSAERRWIVKHALRSLVKAGHPGALTLLGVGAKPKVVVEAARFTPMAPKLGGVVSFAFTLASAAKKTQTIQVDYAVHFVKANGTSAPKVFKLRRLELGAGERVVLGSKVSFAPMTTRKTYAGEHRFEALVNGQRFPLGAVRLQ